MIFIHQHFAKKITNNLTRAHNHSVALVSALDTDTVSIIMLPLLCRQSHTPYVANRCVSARENSSQRADTEQNHIVGSLLFVVINATTPRV